MSFDVYKVREDFPILADFVHGDIPLVYLDSAATSQKPISVLDAERDFYLHHNGSVHRGAHALAESATMKFEESRRKIADFIGAAPQEIVFTKNATESLNVIAYAFSNATAKKRSGNDANPDFVLEIGDEILVSEMEHHANLIPWQEVALKTGAVLKFIPLTDDGRLNFTENLVTERTRVVAVTHQSNIMGTINDVANIGSVAHRHGAFMVVDACQSVPHMSVNVGQLNADFVAFSGHKMLGPLGIGVLWGRNLDEVPVFITGGSMIETVYLESSTYAKAPQRFEAGTSMVAQAVGLAAAVDYLSNLGMANIAAHEHGLTELAISALHDIKGVNIIGPQTSKDRGGSISFTVDGIHPHDVGQVLDSVGIAVRVGHHCAWPVCRRYGVPATTRASFYLYNTEAEVDALVKGIYHARKFFGAA
jgi:cysteine desulfurase/selenocysteine lyase